MSVVNICSITALLLKFIATHAADSEEVPLEIIWNVPTGGKGGCEDTKGVPIDVHRYGIRENSNVNTSSMVGEIITVIWSHNLGRWPYINETTNEPVNKGLPQLGNLTAHLEKLEKDINQTIEDRQFSGLGVMDFEAWFALAAMNPMRYKDASRKLAREQHPQLTDQEIKNIAFDDFNQAAKSFMEQTLLKAKEMRPHAKWGYYIYPKCNYRIKEKDCASNWYNFGKEVDWLVKGSDALYPSIYYKSRFTEEERSGMAKYIVNVTRTWLNYTGDIHKPIYVYTQTMMEFDNDGLPVYYDDFDLISSLGVTADMGVDGLILWGAGKRRASEKQCEFEKAHLKKLGPYAERLLKFFRNCARDVCNNNGRCAKKYVEVDPTKMNRDLDKDHIYDMEDAKRLYRCRCYKGWKGEDCTEME